ncbi:MAG: M20 family metallo-hydrolase [Synergistales bacterium]|nr:M20 family metallo-hydrolase [Synergistales bacterium]MDY6401061.1 M20 family metallo-hydrolase [Synergistales bacterium]MDY6404654.1 M20 family metallo-hydrolase [Synergistales bacterium]MDY6410930.1 M20 family metallo-hydrolase [Synergistales bacterium]MDY6415099.1 M20 family metallo-hydrolase [Synergistales bacterium]
MRGKILSQAEKLEGLMIDTLTRLCKIPAISPHNGGTGEDAKIAELEKIIHELGLDEKAKIKIEYVDDEKAVSKKRPSLFLEYPGKKSQRLCILTHVDIVPEGDRNSWTLDPFQPEIRGSRLYGRGVSDNGTGLVSSLFALKALLNAGVEPEYTVNLAFVADEEMGSHYGLEALLERNLYRSDDLVVVPDSGNDAGDFIEIAEKADWKLKFTVIGKQVHAALPHTGINACRAANILAYEVDEALHKAFPEEDKTFDPPFSTFEPTRRFANVPNTNTVPGREVFEFDCRVLPSVSLDEAFNIVEKIRKDTEIKTGAKIELTVSRNDAAPVTSPDSEVVKLLVKSINEVLNIEPKTGGIGGGTFAALFRRKGIPAVVWSQECGGVAHQPDEFTEINYIVNNAKVFALMMMGM